MPTLDRPPWSLPAAVLATLPGTLLGLSSYVGGPTLSLAPPVAALVHGTAIVGAAFLLSWAAEAAQVDISAGLALALLALLAVLPEYAVDFVFATRCGTEYAGGSSSPEVCSLALANMTGANRVLVGVGWPLVVLVAGLAVWRAARRREQDRAEVATPSTRSGEVRLAPAMSVEVGFLGFATLYSLTLPLRATLGLWDALLLVGLFAAYAWRLARMPPTEPELLGVSAWLGDLPVRARRVGVATLFLVGAVVILATAEHFADGLVETGRELQVSEFLLVQWVAPLASESPELIVACLYAWRLKAEDSLGTLLSSKVNQWTLLVGGLPVVFAVTAGTLDGLPLDTHQRYELLITGAQSLFAVALLLDLRITHRGAVALLALFLTQFGVSVLATERANQITIVVLSVVYVGAATVMMSRRRHRLARLVRESTVTPFDELAVEPEPERSA